MMQAGTLETDNGPSSSSKFRHSLSQSCPSNTGRILFSSLPVEVTSIVFTHFIYSSSSPKPSPLTLGKICHRWRQIAWSTPELWVQLSIENHQDKSEVMLELAEEWLNRSATLPLTINYSSDFGPGRYNYTNEQILEFCRRMVEVLSRRSDRWYSLTLDLPSEVIEGLEEFPQPLSSLHYLSLRTFYPDEVFEYDPNNPRIFAFSNCSPRIVQITCLKVAIDWTSVTNLNIESINVSEVLYILQRASNVCKCEILDVNNYGTSISTEMEFYSPITQPLLVSLDMSFYSGDAFTIFCRAMSLPALKHLSVVMYGRIISAPYEFSMDDFTMFLTNSSCALESLVINESDFEPGSLIRLVPLLSSLKKLTIQFGLPLSNRDTFYHFLADSTQMSNTTYSGIPLLPSLEVFEWDGCGSYPWNTIPGLLEPLTNSCTPHRRPLKRVSIWCSKTTEITPSYIPKEVIKRLSDFSGVEFEIICDSFFTEEVRIDWLKASLESQDEG